MPLSTRPTPSARPRPGAAVLVILAGAAALGGCTALSGDYVAPVVVTYTPTVTVTPKGAAPAPSASATPSATKTDIPSDVVGNAYDLGRIVRVADDGGTKVVSLDRYQKSGVRSTTLAREGITLEPHTREHFVNTASRLYSVPVLPTATFTKATCTSADAPATRAPSTLEELAGLQGRAGIVLLELDDKGWLRAATSDPVCE